VCRLVCEMRKVPKTTYDCECEEFCVAGPSTRSTVCDDCGCKRWVYTPTCGKVRTRTKLIKNETFTEKMTYKWVVEDLCCKCADKAGAKPSDVALAAAVEKPGATAQAAGFQAPASPDAKSSRRAVQSPAAALPKFDMQRVLDSLKGRN